MDRPRPRSGARSSRHGSEARLAAWTKAAWPLAGDPAVLRNPRSIAWGSITRDAMPAGGQLRIAVSAAKLTKSFVKSRPGAHVGPHILLEVSDTGVGMDDVTKYHLFEPFFTTKPRGQGTGLGLASV